MAATIRLVPLGGLGEIGKNCFAIEQDGEVVLIDCGASFPFDDYGVDVVFPRFDWLLERPDALAGVVLTHGHEDHVGAVAHLAGLLADSGRRLRVWGPRYAVELARLRCDEQGVDPSWEIVRPGDRFEVGPFRFEPIRVTHSIVDATALLVDTKVGRVLHSGDFKLDPHPSDGEPTDVARLERAGDEGVALLLSDSTNTLLDGSTGSERVAHQALDEVIGGHRGRVVVGLFASNVHRLAALGQVARRHGRRLCLLGRSLVNHAALGRRLGYLDWPSDLVVAPDVARALPLSAVIYLATGTQGEGRAALRRLASGEHHELRLEPGDLVVLSSRAIPGHARAVNAMVSDLVRAGVRVETAATLPAIHVSGHAHRDEQRRLLELVRPRAFIPLHGTSQHLVHHAELARSLGVPEVLVMHDGDSAELDGERLGRGEPVVAGAVATAFGRRIGEDVLRARAQLGRGGVVFVALAGSGAGLVAQARTEGLARDVEREVVDAARRAAAAAGPDGDVVEAVRLAVRRRLELALGYRPTTHVALLAPEPLDKQRRGG